ncbi:hypothetical protein FKM82_001477 [Ascaphus truei]
MAGHLLPTPCWPAAPYISWAPSYSSLLHPLGTYLLPHMWHPKSFIPQALISPLLSPTNTHIVDTHTFTGHTAAPIHIGALMYLSSCFSVQPETL